MSIVDVFLKVMVIITKHSYYLRNLFYPDINIYAIKKLIIILMLFILLSFKMQSTIFKYNVIQK